MPSRPMKPCAAPGCTGLTQERFCGTHKDRSRQPDRDRGTAAQRGYGSQWRKARIGFLKKNPLCVTCKQQGKITAASVVDHIKAHKGDKVLFWDRLNWQGLCKTCHSIKTAQEDGGYGNKQWVSKETLEQIKRPTDLHKSAIPLTIVCGPPGSGKTTFVQMHKNPGDIVIDLDEIIARLSGQTWYKDREQWIRPALLERNRMLRELATTRDGHAWLIVMAPKRVERDWWSAQLGSSVVVLDVPADICTERIDQDNRRAGQTERFKALVTQWWRDYTQ